MPRLVAYLLLLTVTSLTAMRVLAIDGARISLESVRGDGWRASGLDAQLWLEPDVIRAEATLDRVQVEGISEPLRDLRITCPDVRLDNERISCARAQVRGVVPSIGVQQFTAAVNFQRRSGALALKLDGVKLAAGAAQLELQLQDGEWRAAVRLQKAAVPELLKLLRTFVDIKGFDGKGWVDARLQARGAGALPREVHWQVAAQSLSVNNPAGNIATDSLVVDSEGSAQREGGAWAFMLKLHAPSGQAYAEPIFVDAGQHALQLQTQGRWSSGLLQLADFKVDQQNVATVSGRGVIAVGAALEVRELHLDIAQLKFPGAYQVYLQPLLLNTAFKAMSTAGALTGRVDISNNWPSAVDLDLKQLTADDGNRLVLKGVDGSLHWRNDETGDSDTHPRSRLSWQSGRLLGLELGATQLELEAWGTTVRVAEPTRIPIFNGALALDAFRIRKAGTPQMAFMLDANIEPINVAQLCRAFGWPEFGGALSGRVTKLRLENGVLTMGATLSAQVFSGGAAISDLRMEGIFSNWPRFHADIKLDNLDLEQVTQAFSFGRITGRLSGEIEDLNLFNWEPVSFDARLYTPANDHSRHRISQRAVQNIGSIGGSGGGVAAALQSGLLRFFEDFNYDRLGLSCRLENEVCLMNGIAPAPTGYYLVKGRGLPRIDVIGNATRVDWPRMVAQLKAVTESSGPVVQ